MAISTTSHNMVILGYERRADGYVRIRFTLTQPGIYWNLPFASKAFQPGDTNGIVMTPALGDPEHAGDPVTAVTYGQVLTWIWNAPADGYTSVSLSGWRLTLGYINLFCCEGDEPDPRPPVEDDPPPPPTIDDPVVPGNPAMPGDGTPPSVGTTPPSSGSGGDTDSANDLEPGTPIHPIPGGFFSPPVLPAPVDPYWPLPGNPVGQPIANYGYSSGGGIEFLADGSFRVGDAVFNRVGNTFFDPYGNPVYSSPTAQAPTPFRANKPTIQPINTPLLAAGGAVIPGLRPVANSNFAATTTEASPLAPTPQGTSAVAAQEFPVPTNLKLSPISTMSATVYALESTNGSLSLAAEMYPSTAPRDVGSTVFATVTNASDSTVSGMTLYAEGMDASGDRYVLQDGVEVPPIPPGGTATKALCTSWMSFINGPVTIAVVLLGPDGQALLSFTLVGQATAPGTLQPPATAISELPASVREAAWGTGATDIDPVFEGSYNAVGNEDFYIINVTSSRVGIVVKITADAQLSGFEPVLKIFSEDDLDTPIVTAQTRFSVPDQDRVQHAIGWRDFAQLPLLQVGQRYLLQVVHKYPFYSRRWGFKIYTKEQVVDTVLTGSVDGDGNLEGSLVSSHGRQSLKLVNDRTQDVLFVRTDSYGRATDVQVNTSPVGDRLAVAAGDILRIYRPGIGVQYRSTDLLTTSTVSA
jgi:hypothetical protein